METAEKQGRSAYGPFRALALRCHLELKLKLKLCTALVASIKAGAQPCNLLAEE